jgi:hypothetical protein
MALFVFTMPGFKGILCWVAQVPDGRSDALTQLQVEPNRSNAVFVRVHELPPGGPSFCPHPPLRQLDFGVLALGAVPVRGGLQGEGKRGGNLVIADIPSSAGAYVYIDADSILIAGDALSIYATGDGDCIPS